MLEIIKIEKQKRRNKIKFMKILPFVLLLLLFCIAPVIAQPRMKKEFTAHVSFKAGNVSLGNQRITEDGILIVKEAISEGTISGTDVYGTLWITLSGSGDLNTNEGDFNGKWIISALGGTFEGRVSGVIAPLSPNSWHVSGTFTGKGAGDYAKVKINGVFEGEAIMGTLEVEVDIKGILSSSNNDGKKQK